jgi:hypothetical protein
MNEAIGIDNQRRKQGGDTFWRRFARYQVSGKNRLLSEDDI